jgi:hypothetical protein
MNVEDNRLRRLGFVQDNNDLTKGELKREVSLAGTRRTSTGARGTSVNVARQITSVNQEALMANNRKYKSRKTCRTIKPVIGRKQETVAKREKDAREAERPKRLRYPIEKDAVGVIGKYSPKHCMPEYLTDWKEVKQRNEKRNERGSGAREPTTSTERDQIPAVNSSLKH